MYWNLSLAKEGRSQWGWPQNSLVAVELASKQYKFNYDYYVLKNMSVILSSPAPCGWTRMARNPDKSVAVILRNQSEREAPVDVSMANGKTLLQLPPDSLNTLLVKPS